jgi:type II secretory pathway predicted ATPase ExeA
MFLEFYHLRQQPFGVTPDPAYLYPSPTHRDALSSLSSGIKEGRGFFALIAEPGMGKTTLLYQLLDELHDSARTVFLFQTQCNSREFFQYLLNELGVDARGMDLVSMHAKLNEILFAEMIAGRRFVLIVDEAQNLEDSVLETVRLLSNFETSYAKMLQIVLAGQPQLSDKLEQPQLAQLRQRIAVLARLEPLSVAETVNYIEHRLKIAGYSGAPLFTGEAAALVAERSRGIPRTINHLCYAALSAAHAKAIETVTADIVEEAASKLGVEAPPEPTAAAAIADPIAVETDESSLVESSQEKLAFTLTYEPAKPFRLPRWASRAFLLTGILLLAGLSLTAFMMRLTVPVEEKPASGSAMARSAPDVPSRGDAAATATSVAAPGEPLQPLPPASSTNNSRNNSASNSAKYGADPQDTGSGQVITVAAMPQQTLEDLSRIYVGRFDSALLEKIRALNPELKDPVRLEAGQLIRLPMPAGAFRKGKGLASEQ